MLTHLLRRLVERRNTEGDVEKEGGFTLIELMVVLLIIAILLAIAIPTFLGARTRAQNRAAESNLRNALTAAKTLYTDTSDYSGVTTTSMQSTEPSLTFTTGSTSTQGNVSVNVSTATTQTVYLAAYSQSGTCYYLEDQGSGGGTLYGKQAGTSCTAPTSGAIPGSQSTSTAAGW
jgi:type IV pilus assembly protein PilA